MGDLLALLEKADKNLRWSVGKAFGEMGTDGLDPLLVMLASRDPEVRRVGATMLAQITVPASAAPAFRAALKDRQWFVRYVAASALGSLGDRASTDALIRADQDDKASVRLAIAKSLGQIGEPRARHVLATLREDKNRVVRVAAREAIAALRTDSKHHVNPDGTRTRPVHE